MSDRTWAGGAYWNFRRRRPVYGDRAWLRGYATYPYVWLRLDDAGGTLLRPRRSQPEIMFAWPEVEKMERVRVFGIPFLGEGVRITLKEVMFWGIPRRLLFFSGTKARTRDILGVRRVQRREGEAQGQEHVRATLRASTPPS